MKPEKIRGIKSGDVKIISFLKKMGVDLKKPSHYRYESEGWMPLVIETWEEGDDALTVSMAHYGKQNGDVMRDPEIVFQVFDLGDNFYTVEPISFRNDYVGVNQVVIFEEEDGKTFKDKRGSNEIRHFLTSVWISNLKAQGHQRVQEVKI